MTEDEIMDMDLLRDANAEGKCWSEDHGWVECCKLCWYPVNECVCKDAQ